MKKGLIITGVCLAIVIILVVVFHDFIFEVCQVLFEAENDPGCFGSLPPIKKIE